MLSGIDGNSLFCFVTLFSAMHYDIILQSVSLYGSTTESLFLVDEEKVHLAFKASKVENKNHSLLIIPSMMII